MIYPINIYSKYILSGENNITYPITYDIILTFQKHYQEPPNNSDSEIKHVTDSNHYKKSEVTSEIHLLMAVKQNNKHKSR